VSQVGVGNLVEILSRSHAVAVAQVGPSATTTSVPLSGINLSSSDLAGGWALFDEGAFGLGSPPTLAPIASNTATSLSFASGVLSTAPTEGYDVWLFQANVFNVSVSSPQNIEQWGGATVAAADANGIPAVRNAYAQGSPGSAAPTQAVQVAGTDGTDLRVMATNASGQVLTVKAQGTTATTVANYKALATSATTAILASSFSVPANGTLNIAVGIESGATASTFLITRDGTRYLAIEQGNSLTAGAEYDLSIPVAAGDSINFQTGAATTLAVLEAFYTAGQG
jgi:hypothetical protein